MFEGGIFHSKQISHQSQEKEAPRDSLLLITIYWANHKKNENVIDKEIDWNI